jgi:integrase
MRITKDTAKNAVQPASGQEFIRDEGEGAITGFAIRLTPGSKAYIWEGKIRRRTRRITLGSCSAITAAIAREKAKKVRAAIAMERDPSEERAAKRGEFTFADMAKEYFERVRDHKAPSTLKEDAGLLRRYVPQGWYSRKLSDISHNDISKLHSTVGREHGHYAANHLLRLQRHIWNCARAWGLSQGEQNPVRGVKLFKEKKRKRFLSPEELRRVNEALIEESDVYWRAFFPLSLLVGTRRGELLAARWKDFNLDTKTPTWMIPNTKEGEPRYLPLASAAAAILRDLPSRGNSQWVFPSHGRTGHLVEVKSAWKRIRDRAGVPDVRPHDLRRTLGSWLAASNHSLPMIGAALGHSQPSTTAVYARIALDPLRAALEANAAQMLSAGGLGARPAEHEPVASGSLSGPGADMSDSALETRPRPRVSSAGQNRPDEP